MFQPSYPAGKQHIGIQAWYPAQNVQASVSTSLLRVPPFALSDEQEAQLAAPPVNASGSDGTLAHKVPPFVMLQRWTEQPYPAPSPQSIPTWSVAETKPHDKADMGMLQEIPLIDIPSNDVNEGWQIPLGRRLRNLTRQLRQQGLRITLIEAADQIHRMIFGLPTVRYSQVTPQIFVGGQHHRKGWRWLQARGVTAVVNMRRESDDRARGIAPERYLHLMVIDNTPPTLEHLRRGVSFISEVVAHSGKVYIHCWEGVGRAPTMCAAYLVSTGMRPDEAWARIRAARPFIRPTPFQRKQVEVYAERYGRRAAVAS